MENPQITQIAQIAQIAQITQINADRIGREGERDQASVGAVLMSLSTIIAALNAQLLKRQIKNKL